MSYFTLKAENDDSLKIKKSLENFAKFVNENEKKPLSQRNYLFLNDDFIKNKSANNGDLANFVDTNFEGYEYLKKVLDTINKEYDPKRFACYIFYGRYFLSYKALLVDGLETGIDNKTYFLNRVKEAGNNITDAIPRIQIMDEIDATVRNANPDKKILMVYLTDSYYLELEDGETDTYKISLQTRIHGRPLGDISTHEEQSLKRIMQLKNSPEASTVAQSNVKRLVYVAHSISKRLKEARQAAENAGEWCPNCPSEKGAEAFDMYADLKSNGKYDLYMFFETWRSGVWVRVDENVDKIEQANSWYRVSKNSSQNTNTDNTESLQAALFVLTEHLINANYDMLVANQVKIEDYYPDYRIKAQLMLIEELINNKANIGWVEWVPIVGSSSQAYYSWKASEALPQRFEKIKDRLRLEAKISALSAATDAVGFGWSSVVKTGGKAAIKQTLKKAVVMQGFNLVKNTTNTPGKFSKIFTYLSRISNIVKNKYTREVLEAILEEAGEQVLEYLDNQNPIDIDKIFKDLPQKRDDAVKYLRKLRDSNIVQTNTILDKWLNGNENFIDAPISGLYESAINEPIGIPFSSKPVKVYTNKKSITSTVNNKDISRSYVFTEKTLIMESAEIDDAYQWVNNEPPLVQGKGVPTQIYITLHQMRKYFEISYGSMEYVKMENIVNVRTITQMLYLKHKNPLKPWNEIIKETHSIRYASTIITQSGHKIKSIIIEPNGYFDYNVLLNDFVFEEEKKNDILKGLNMLKVDRTIKVPISFNIIIKVEKL